MPLTIKTLQEALAIGCGETDGPQLHAAVDAVAAGRSGFWLKSAYHNQVFGNAIYTANNESLDAACRYAADFVCQPGRGGDVQGFVGQFLDCLFPANDTAVRDMILARSKWCSSFEVEAA